MNNKFVITLEKGKNELWGRIDVPGIFLTSVGNNIEEVTNYLRASLIDFVTHESNHGTIWDGFDVDSVEFEYAYDLTAFFELFSELKVGGIAERANMSPSLVRQYATGAKSASLAQVKKLQNAVNEYGRMLSDVKLTIIE